MSAWLEPVREVLGAAPRPLDVFFRDDDVGWDDARLRRLLDLFDDLALPLDLAVIPMAVTPSLARELTRRREASAGRLGLHQHGFAHLNHEPNGRKCEFGPTRARDRQLRDVADGATRLRELLGESVEPIFTPPWNRCEPVTGECLVAVGFVALSREARAEPLRVPGLLELPVAVDWSGHRKGVPLTRDDLGLAVASALARPEPTGIMFHHAQMDDAERDDAARLLSLLAAHPSVRPRTMRSLVVAERGGAAHACRS